MKKETKKMAVVSAEMSIVETNAKLNVLGTNKEATVNKENANIFAGDNSSALAIELAKIVVGDDKLEVTKKVKKENKNAKEVEKLMASTTEAAEKAKIAKKAEKSSKKAEEKKEQLRAERAAKKAAKIAAEKEAAKNAAEKIAAEKEVNIPKEENMTISFMEDILKSAFAEKDMSERIISASKVKEGFPNLLNEYRQGNLSVVDYFSETRNKGTVITVRSDKWVDLLDSNAGDVAAAFKKVANTVTLKDCQLSVEALLSAFYNFKVTSNNYSSIKVAAIEMIIQAIIAGYDVQVIMDLAETPADLKKKGNNMPGIPFASGTLEYSRGIEVDLMESTDKIAKHANRNKEKSMSVCYALNATWKGMNTQLDKGRIGNYAFQQAPAPKETYEVVLKFLGTLSSSNVIFTRHTNYSYSNYENDKFAYRTHVHNQKRVAQKPTTEAEIEVANDILNKVIQEYKNARPDVFGERRLIGIPVVMNLTMYANGRSYVYLCDEDASGVQLIDRSGMLTNVAKATGTGFAKDGLISAMYKGTFERVSLEMMQKMIPGFDGKTSVVFGNPEVFKHVSRRHVEGDVATVDLYIMNAGQNVKGDAKCSEKSVAHPEIMKMLVDEFAIVLGNGHMNIASTHRLSFTNVLFDGGEDGNTYVYETKEAARAYGLSIGVPASVIDKCIVQKDGKYALLIIKTNDKGLLRLAKANNNKLVISREPAYGNAVVVYTVETEAPAEGWASTTKVGYGVSVYMEALDEDGDTCAAYKCPESLDIGYIFESTEVTFDKERIEKEYAEFEKITDEKAKEAYINKLFDAHWERYTRNNKLEVITSKKVEGEKVKKDFKQIAKFIGSQSFISSFTMSVYRLGEMFRYEALAWLVEQPVQAMKHGANLVKFLLIIQQINELQSGMVVKNEIGVWPSGDEYSMSFADLQFKYANRLTEVYPFVQRKGNIGHIHTLIDRAIVTGDQMSEYAAQSIQDNTGVEIDYYIASEENYMNYEQMINEAYGIDEKGKSLATKEQRVEFFVKRFMNAVSDVIGEKAGDYSDDTTKWSVLFGMIMLTNVDTACYWSQGEYVKPVYPCLPDTATDEQIEHSRKVAENEAAAKPLQNAFFNEILVKKAEGNWKHMFHTINLCRMISRLIIDGKGVSIFNGGDDFTCLNFSERMEVVRNINAYFVKRTVVSGYENAPLDKKIANAKKSLKDTNSVAGFIPPSVLAKAVLTVMGFDYNEDETRGNYVYFGGDDEEEEFTF